MRSNMSAVYGPKFTKFCDRVKDLSQFRNLFRFTVSHFVLKTFVLTVRCRHKTTPKYAISGPTFSGQGPPNFKHSFSNLAHFRTNGEVYVFRVVTVEQAFENKVRR